MNFGLADVNYVNEGFLHMLKKINSLLASLADYGGICAWYISGKWGSNAHYRETDTLKKQVLHSRVKVEFNFFLDVP